MNQHNRRIAPLLRVTFLAGLLLLVIIGALLVGAAVSGRGAAGGVRESAFHRLLREYDFKYLQLSGAEAVRRQEVAGLDGALDRLEKHAAVVEMWLSILKRRRQLARVDSRYEEAYRQSARRAAAVFPNATPIAAIAAAALVHNAAITRENEALLREALPLLVGSRFVPLSLSLHVLLGDFKTPERALAGQPRNVMAPANFTATDLEREVIYPDLTILKILAGDIPSAAIDIQTALNVFPSPGIIRLAAEYFYDFGDLLRSAQLFSGLTDEAALGRQADALWLAGHPDTARNIWAMATGVESHLRYRSLYNLAVTAKTRDEAERLLGSLAAGPAIPRDSETAHSVALPATLSTAENADFTESASPEENTNFAGNTASAETAAFSENAASFRLFGLIRYSRLFEAPRALEILESGKKTAGSHSAKDGLSEEILTDLEILRRRAEIREPARTIADTWLLLDRHSDTEELYEWGAWYFGFQRNYTESDILLRNASRNNFSGQWFGIHEGLKLLRQGNIEGAEEILDSVNRKNVNWTAAANLGRIYEARHSPTRALESYQKAAETLTVAGYTDGRDDGVFRRRRETASRIQVGIARSLKTLDRTLEGRQTLEYALELNPDNLTARLELGRSE